MTEVETWSRIAKAEKAKTALVKNGFDAVVVKTGAEAAALLMSHVGAGTTMGFGGSMTIKALGIQRFDLKYSAGTLPHEKSMHSIELYGSKVIPMVKDMLNS